MAQQTRTAGDLFRDLRLLREWKARHPGEVIGYPSENQNRMWSWRDGYYTDIDRLVPELVSWEDTSPQ